MNRVAYVFGVCAVLLSMAATVLVRTYTDAMFLAGWGARGLPLLLALSTLGFVVATTSYGLLARRIRPARLDVAVSLLLGGLFLAAPLMFAGGRGAILAASVALLALSSVASLAAWNAVASTVRGRMARRFLPRAGAAATFGAMTAGFGGSALVQAVGVDVLPRLLVGLTGLSLVAGIALTRRLHRQPLPAPPPARRAGALAGEPRRLTRWLIVVALGEAATGALIEYQFKSELAHTYGRNEIAAFISAYIGVTNLGVLILQVYAVPRILATRSLSLSFAVQPVAMIGAFLGSLIAPGLMTLAFARTLDQVLKFSVSRGSQEVSLSPLPPADAARWKMLLRGGATQVGAATIALLLLPMPGLARAAPWAISIAGLLFASAWLWSVRRAARAYLAALAAALGVRRLSLDTERQSDTDLDREGMRAIVELAGAEDAQKARFGQAMLSHVCRRGAELSPHVGHARAPVRRAVYRELARRPDRAGAGLLRAAVLAERDDTALVVGLDALGLHDGLDGRTSAPMLARARQVAREGGVAAASARAYLAEVGAATAYEAWAAFGETLTVDGARAARIALAERTRGRRTGPEIEAALERAMQDEHPERRREACRAAAVAARHLSCRGLIAALAAGEPAASAAITEADGPGLIHLVAAARAESGAGSARVRARLARALRASDRPEAAQQLVSLLGDGDEGVREAAARGLAKQVRDRRASVPERAIDRAALRELDRLAVYLAARAPAGVRPELHEDELARQAALCLERVLAIVALAGNPTTVLAAARRIRSGDERDRRGGLDLLQEVARGEPRRRLLAVLEKLLTPPRAAPSDEASRAVRVVDPWLDRVLGGAIDADAWRLRALRRTALFDEVPGEALHELAAAGVVVEVPDQTQVVREGDAGDALYVVEEGQLEARRGETRVGVFGPGDAFGELALIDGSPRGATVEARGAARLLRVPREAFHAVLAARPEMGLGLLHSLARWLRGSPQAR